VVAHILVPREQAKELDGNIGVGIVKEERDVGVEVVVIGRSAFLAKSFTCLFMVKAAEAVECQDFIDVEDIAVLLTIVRLVEAAVEIADNNGSIVLEVGGVFAEDFLGYLRICFLARNLFTLRGPNGEDEYVAGYKGNSIEVTGIVPIGDVTESFFPYNA